MVSVKRARECIGRQVRHTNTDLNGKGIAGVVTEVTINANVRIRTPEGDHMVCDPENLVWDDSRLSPAMVEAVRAGHPFDNNQVGYDPSWGGVGVVYSSALANDDGDERPLYVVLPGMKRVHLASPIADPQLIYTLEEALGWAEA